MSEKRSEKIIIHEGQKNIFDILGEHYVEPGVVVNVIPNSLVIKINKYNYIIARKSSISCSLYSLEFCFRMPNGSVISAVGSINEYQILYIYKSNGQYCSINHDLVGAQCRTDLIGSDSEISEINKYIKDNNQEKIFSLLRKISKKI